MPVNIEIVANAIAQSGAIESKQFRTEEHKRALQYIAAESDPADLVDNIGRIGNVSAVRQELEKGGIIPAKESDSALIRAIKTAIGRKQGINA